MSKTPMHPGTYTSIKTETADALRAQLERFGIETSGKDADALVETATDYARRHADIELELRPGYDPTTCSTRLATLEAAQKVCIAILNYRNEPAVTMTGQPNERKSIFRDYKNNMFSKWLEIHQAKQQEGAASGEA